MRYRFTSFQPGGEIGNECECGCHSDEGDVCVEDFLDDFFPRDSAGEHDRDRGDCDDVPCEFEKVGFPCDGGFLWLQSSHCGRLVATARDFDTVHSKGVQRSDDVKCIGGRESTTLKVGRVELDGEGKAGLDGCTDTSDDRVQRSSAVFEWAAPSVSPFVDERREELAE